MLPNLEQLKSMHYQLLGCYVERVNQVDAYDFFVKTDFDEKGEPIDYPGGIRGYPMRIGYWFESLVCWKPVVQFFMESHIRRRQVVIRRVYEQVFYTIDPSTQEAKKLQAWLKEAIANIKGLEGTLQSRQIMSNLLKVITGQLAAILAAIMGFKIGDGLIAGVYNWSQKNPIQTSSIVAALSTIVLILFITYFPLTTPYYITEKLLRIKKGNKSIRDMETDIFKAHHVSEPKDISFHGIMLNMLVFITLCALLGINHLLPSIGMQPLFPPPSIYFVIGIAVIFLLVINI